MDKSNKNTESIKYILYARKSSESEDRQVASIDSQINELTKLAQREELKIVETITESKSAKSPGREEFNKMLDQINRGKAQGIICWKLDRLARNPIDGGQISWMLQQGIIKHIQTYERSYYPTDNVLMMAMELGMANQFIRDLSITTKRGLKTKAEKGWLPGRAPIGYLNNPFKIMGNKDIVKDPERFDLVRKAWDLLLEKQYSIDRIYRIIVNEWGLRKRNNKKFHRSKIYKLFTNPFYYGYFYYGGVLYKGAHEPMITKEEFDRAQVILGNRSKPRVRTHAFAFTGLMRCGECEAMITAEEKIKHQKNGNVHHYTYYRCTRRKDPNCRQPAIREEELEKQILEILGSIEIPTEFHQWAMKCLKEENEKEAQDRNTILASQQKAYENCVKKIDALIDMRAAKEISEEEFKNSKSAIMEEKIRLEELLRDTGSRVDKWLDEAEQLFTFAEMAKERFEIGDLETKHQILACLGSNLLLKDEKLSIYLPKPLLVLTKFSQGIETLSQRLEPVKSGKNKRDFEQIYTQNPFEGG